MTTLFHVETIRQTEISRQYNALEEAEAVVGRGRRRRDDAELSADEHDPEETTNCAGGR